MSKERIFLSSPHMSDEQYEMEYIKEAFDKNWIAPLGENVDQFELELANYVAVDHALAVSSGTAAIHLALKLAGVQKDDIVFCQSFTFAASANPIIYEGATPVFIDSEEKTWNMDPKQLEQAFKKYPNAKAVVVVHLYGVSADMDPIKEICDKYGAVLIEDAAESLGSKYKGQYTGTIGDYGIYSFNGNKIITTSGGGMLVTNKKDAKDKALFWSTQARENYPYYHHKELGYNYRMSNVVAGIGRGQLKVLKDRVKKKEYIYNYYKNKLSKYKEVCFMPHNEWDQPNFWLSCFLIKHPTIKPQDIIEHLESYNIESRHVWKPMHQQPFYKKYDYFGTGVSDMLFEYGVCLPSDTKMTDEDLDRVVDAIMELLDE